MIAELAALLSQEQMWEALRRIEPRSDFMGSSTRALASLLPYADHAQVEQAFNLVLQFDEDDGFEYGITDADNALCVRLLAFPIDEARRIWQGALVPLASKSRGLFVQHMIRFAPLLERLYGDGVVDHVILDWVDAFRRWP